MIELLKVYLKNTARVRNNENSLFNSFAMPYTKVSKDTISRWIKTVLKLAGVDIKYF